MPVDAGPDPAVAPFLCELTEAAGRNDLQCPTFVDASLGARMALSNPDLSVAQLAKVVSQEPLLSARVVAFANSAAMHRGGKPVSDVKSAVMRVGQAAVRNIAVAIALQQVSHARELEPVRAQARDLLEHGLEVGVLSHVLALHCGSVAPDDALFAGLVHDLGQFYALWRATQFPALAGRLHEVRTLAHEAHAAIGARLLETLRLAPAVVLAVREHEAEPAGLPPGGLSRILSVANRCANHPVPPDPAPQTDAAPAAPRGAIDETSAQRILAEHFDEVTWLLAVMRG